MNTVWRKLLPFMTADDFLDWPGDGSGRTFQLVDGEVRPVSPASATHALIQANLAFLLKTAIRAAGLPLHVGTETAIVPALNAGTNVRVPDLGVTATPVEQGQQTLSEPLLIIEVLSPGNQDDTRDNIRAYATLPSVREMAVLYSTRLLAEVHRRDPGGNWLPDPEVVGQDGRLRLPSAALDVPLAEAYEGTWLVR